jgi:hypothetical protein
MFSVRINEKKEIREMFIVFVPMSGKVLHITLNQRQLLSFGAVYGYLTIPFPGMSYMVRCSL